MPSLEQRRACAVESEGHGPHAAGPVIAKVSATVTLFLLTSCALADSCSSDVAVHSPFAERGAENQLLGSLLYIFRLGVSPPPEPPPPPGAARPAPPRTRENLTFGSFESPTPV